MGSENKTLLWSILGILVVGLIASSYFTAGAVKNLTFDQTDSGLTAEQARAIAEAAANNVVASIPARVTPAPTEGEAPLPDADKISSIYDEVLKEQMQEDKALVMATEELESADFKRIVRELLNAELPGSEWPTSQIESWRDIESISISESDVEVSGDSATVSLELKVSFFLDGDEDEEDLKKAKIVVEFEVEDLDEDEEFEEAEIVEYTIKDFEFIKFY